MLNDDLFGFLAAKRQSLESATDPVVFLETYDRFLEDLRSFAECTSESIERAVREHGPFYRRVQQRVLELREFADADVLLADADAPNKERGEQFSGAFAADAYSRVADLAQLADIPALRRIVVAGCGALPATLLWMADHFPAADYVGIDFDDRCVATAARLADHLMLNQVKFICMDAAEFDYSGVDFVFVANQVRPKQRVLERVAATIERAISVVVREPTSIGRLLAEPVGDDLPPGYTVVRVGASSAAFLSRDLFLDLHLDA